MVSIDKDQNTTQVSAFPKSTKINASEVVGTSQREMKVSIVDTIKGDRKSSGVSSILSGLGQLNKPHQ